VFVEFDAASDGAGYITYASLPTYDVNLCAAKCNAISLCNFFNIFYERDPSVIPGTGTNCLDPSSTTNIKCSLWSVLKSDPTNIGQRRAEFQVVIGGSNGYAKSAPDEGIRPARFVLRATGSGTIVDGEYFVVRGTDNYLSLQFVDDSAAATLFTLSATGNLVALTGPAAGSMAYAYLSCPRVPVSFRAAAMDPHFQALACYVSTSNILKCNTDYTNLFAVSFSSGPEDRNLYTFVHDRYWDSVYFPMVTLVAVAV